MDFSFTYFLFDKRYSNGQWQRWFKYFSTLANGFVIGRFSESVVEIARTSKKRQISANSDVFLAVEHVL